MVGKVCPECEMQITHVRCLSNFTPSLRSMPAWHASTGGREICVCVCGWGGGGGEGGGEWGESDMIGDKGLLHNGAQLVSR